MTNQPNTSVAVVTTSAWSIWVALSAFGLSSAAAQSLEDPRSVAVREINDLPAFLVRVDVDHPDRIYRTGEAIQVSIRSERSGYVYLFYCDANKQVACLFPNGVQSDNYIPANQSIVIPDTSAGFQLRVGPPLGSEILKAVVTTKPLQSLELQTLIKSHVTPLKPRKLKAVFVEVNGDDPDLQGSPALPEERRVQRRSWAEHHVPVTTIARSADPPDKPDLGELPGVEEFVVPARPSDGRITPAPHSPNRPKRVGVFVGLSKYRDPGIRPLQVAHRDAQQLAAAMQQYGRLDELVVLTDEQATRHNLKKTLLESLPAATRAGDLVVIYWSGHGGRTSNLDGTEPDGYDEYLVPYDGQLEPAAAIRDTMLLDKTFGRWVQELDGRRLVVVIDACHSGGQTQGAVKALSGGDSSTPFRKFFFATTWKRTKDIGQRETAVLASSRATQVSFERRAGDLSVMTHFLIEKLRGNTTLTLREAVDYLKVQVPAFVEEHFPGTTQTPIFVSQTTAPVYLIPSTDDTSP